MSGLKVPVFFGLILSLVIVVLQNRTPIFELTLLGMRFPPLPLGLLVAGAVLSGLFLGAILQRTGRRAIAKPRPPSTPREGSAMPEFQTFRQSPDGPIFQDSDSDEFDFDNPDPEPVERPEQPPVSRSTGAKGWDSGGSSSWAGSSGATEEGFWSRPAKAKPRKRRTGSGSVTPINPDLTSPPSSNNARGTDPGIVEAEYRIVTPIQRADADEFDDEFFDDFFEEKS
jgi:hypothetical protein